MSFVIAGNSASTGYNLTRSLRFRASASAYLNRTYSNTQTNAKIQTFSWWYKCSALGTVRDFFGAYDGTSATAFTIYLDTSDRFNFDFGGASTNTLTTTQVFRDPSAWYHFVLAVDTTQATSSNRYKLYVNGVQVTAFGTANYVAQNADSPFGKNNGNNRIGTNWNNASQFLDGYLTEVNFIDGQALTPSSFGSTNATTGVWQPARYTGTYGTNGFYLPFTNNALVPTYAGSFNGSSQYLSTTATGFNPSTGTFTLEGWAYCNSSGNTDSLLIGKASGVVKFYIDFGGTTLYVGDGTINNITAASAKPVGSWFHWALVRSGTTYTMYINGSSVGSSTTALSSNTITIWDIGARTNTPSYVNGYISNVRINTTTAVYTANFTPPTAPLTAISGTQLLTLQNATIIDNSTNAYTITNTGSVVTSVQYPFAGNGLGLDYSGNNNNWLTNNISITAGVTYDSMTDVPTLTSATAANFAVLNPLDNGGATVNAANLNWDSGGYQGTRASFFVSTGKWYWEITSTEANLIGEHGVAPASKAITGGDAWPGSSTGGWGFSNNSGNKSFNATQTNITTAGTNGDVMMYALNMDTGKIWFGRNGTWFSSGDPAAGTNEAFSSVTGTLSPMTGVGGAAAGSVSYNFGQRPFTYTPPTGFVALNTYNLPTSTIVKGNTVMDATLYTGNGSTQTITNAAGFKPDLVWAKARSSASWWHILVDSVRGVGRTLSSNVTNAEIGSGTDLIPAINSNGFNVNVSPNATVNENATTYVAWQWQAGQGSSSSNTNGTITSTVSVNASAGFSVVTYTGTAVAGTIGHGLGVAPQLIIVKPRTGTVTTDAWNVYHVSIGNTQFLELNATNAAVTATNRWNSTSPTSSVFSIGTVPSSNAVGYVAYCWTPIAGFSAFGSYTGNGSTDGPFVYLGFRPKFVLVKNTGLVSNWAIFDSTRNPYNITNFGLVPNLSDAETSGSSLQLLSNGFKWTDAGTTVNQSGATLIYMAFAENPFRNSLAR